VLFGDGAGAVVLGLGERGGLVHVHVGQDPSGVDRCLLANSLVPPAHLADVAAPLGAHWSGRPAPVHGNHGYWDGPHVFENAVLRLGQAVERALGESGHGPEQVDHFLIHQANAKILRSVVRNFGLPPERVHANIEEVGNISSATVPVLLSAGLRDGRIRTGDRVLMAAFGVGYTWGAAVLEV
jgi:3-oxoacyl-[acyl-carrier-protein] synthase-3